MTPIYIVCGTVIGLQYAWLTTNTCLANIAKQLARIADTQEEAHK